MATTKSDVPIKTHCEECGCELKGEAAYIEAADEVWCHSCADNAAEASYERMCEDFHDGGNMGFADGERMRMEAARKLK